MRTDFHLGSEVYHATGGVDLVIRPGECLGLVGESGSGKSVTAMSIMGLVPSPPGVIAGGRIGFKGEDLAKASDKRIRQLRGGAVSHVFQDPLATLHPLFPVGDQIVEAIRAHQPLPRHNAETRAREAPRSRPHSQCRTADEGPAARASPAVCASASRLPWRSPTIPN
ncbi:ATP-binding cassette domain-containing protein [Jiella pelagia]|uniref:ATP-binding cassette domain-containing protein n=1 Tax=Jiella pelagia TaxID=2986949 RepID=UPI0038B35C7C